MKRSVIYFLLLLAAAGVQAQHKGLVSSDLLLQMAQQETRQGNYQQAMAHCRKALTQSPDYTDVRLLMGRLYLLTGQPDAARQEWLTALKKAPANQDALQYLINLEGSRQRYREALAYADIALRNKPGDKTLLFKKYGLLQESGQTAEQGRLLAQLNTLFPNDARVRAMQQEYAAQQRRKAGGTEVAVKPHQPGADNSRRPPAAYNAAARPVQVQHNAPDIQPNAPDTNPDIQHQRINELIKAGHINHALALTDTLLLQQPEDTVLLAKKAGLQETLQQYTAAAATDRALMGLSPFNPRYRGMYADHLVAAARVRLKAGDAPAARPLLLEALQYDRHNPDTWLYLVNMESAAGNYAQGAKYCDSALLALGNNTLFLQKKSALLQEDKQYAAAAGITETLLQQRPGDTGLQQMYADQLTAYGYTLQRANAWDSAAAAFKKALPYRSADTALLISIVNTQLAQQQYDSAVAYADKGLQLYPQQPTLLMKRTTALEQAGRYAEAAAGARVLQQLQPGNRQLRDYHAYLAGKTYRNQAGIIHLQSIYDNGSRPAGITAFQYQRFHAKGSVAGRISYGEREGGSGIQLEAETYYNHNARYYSYGLLSWSNASIFPSFRAGYSLFRNFSKGWEGELGARYLRADSMNVVSGVWSVGKYWGNYWANLRGYVINTQGNWYQAYALTTRWYLNDRKDFLSLLLSVGTTPDDRSRNFQFNEVVGLRSRAIGAGYQKTFGYRTTVGLTGSYIHQETLFHGYSGHFNQYDIYLTLLHKF